MNTMNPFRADSRGKKVVIPELESVFMKVSNYNIPDTSGNECNLIPVGLAGAPFPTDTIILVPFLKQFFQS